MSYLVDNIGVNNLFKHIVSTTSLYEINLVILILTFLYIHSCTMEDNPLLMDVCLVVILITLLTPSHFRYLYTQALLVCIIHQIFILILLL